MIWLLYLHILIVCLGIFYILIHGSRPTKSLSWIIIISILPAIGILGYFFFGINRRKVKLFTLKQTIRRRIFKKHQEHDDYLDSLSEQNKSDQKLKKLIYSSNGFAPKSGNHITTYQEGEAVFEALFETIEKAKTYIYLEYYIIENGILLDRLVNLLAKKLDEGIEVRILYDHLGSFYLSNAKLKLLKSRGAYIYPSMPMYPGSFLFSLNYRNHRKIAIIDGYISFTGGVNISDKYIRETSKLGIWKDFHLKIEGPATDSLLRVFIKDYYFASKEKTLLDHRLQPVETVGNKEIQIIASGPDSEYAAIMQQYIMMVLMAKESVCIANPYFIPNAPLLEALKMASLSGIDIFILIPKKSDSLLAKYSMFSYFEELLSAGIQIFMEAEYFFHSKMICVDQRIVSIGSGNFDYRSFEQNFETNAVIYDSDFAKKTHEDFMNLCNRAEAIDASRFNERGIYHKLLEGVMRLFSPLL